MTKTIKRKKSSKKVTTGDQVKVIAGNYKGVTGTVLSRKGDRVLVQGINMKKKHVKPTEHNPKGDILSIEAPIHISNVQICVGGDCGVKLKVKSSPEGVRSFVYMDGKSEKEFREVKKSKRK